MTAELTFVPGRVPGIAQPATRKTAARKGLPHAAAPRSAFTRTGAAHITDEAQAPGMTLAQRRALSALIHTPAGRRDPFGRTTAAWIAVLAGALAWTLALAVELAPGVTAAASEVAAPARLAMPHVAETGPTA